jgi:hypothetical protein
MRSLIYPLVLCLLLNCSFLNKNLAKTVVDISLALCLAANALKSDAQIQEICGYANDVAPVVKQLVGVHRAQLAKATGVCIDKKQSVPMFLMPPVRPQEYDWHKLQQGN